MFSVCPRYVRGNRFKLVTIVYEILLNYRNILLSMSALLEVDTD